MLAIEAEFGSLFQQDDQSADVQEKNPSLGWSMFYEAISRKNKFSKLKDAINIAKKEKSNIAKE